jgi:hypothetical protein
MYNGSICFLDGLGLDFGAELRKLSVEQRASFDRLRLETFPAARRGAHDLGDVKVDNFTLLKFLRADKYDDKRAAARLLKTLAWWSQRKVDRILAEPPAALARSRRLRVRMDNGFDYEGCLVKFDRLGEFFGCYNCRELSQEDWLQCYTHELVSMYGSMRESSRQRGVPIERMTYVGDLSGLRFMPALSAIHLLKVCTEVVEVHFPETAGHVFLINAPAITAKLFSVVKRFLDPSVRSKIQIHSGVPTDILLKTIPSHLLPVEYGGTSSFVLPHVVDASKHDIDQVDDIDQIDISDCDKGVLAAVPLPTKASASNCFAGIGKLCSFNGRGTKTLEGQSTPTLMRCLPALDIIRNEEDACQKSSFSSETRFVFVVLTVLAFLVSALYRPIELLQFSVHSTITSPRTRCTSTPSPRQPRRHSSTEYCHTHAVDHPPDGSEDHHTSPRQQACAKSQEGKQAAASLVSPPSSPRDFSGNWKLTSIEGDWDQFCVDIGYSYLKRMAFKAIGYGVGLLTEEIRQDNSGDEGCTTVITVSPIRTIENTFRVNGEKQDGVFADGEHVEIFPRWDGDDHMVDIHMNGKWHVSQRRSLAGGIHCVTIESASGKKVKRFFKKQ